mgnify:CR=1 FL=1
MVRRYGSEHCNEMRLLERGSGTVVAGVLIQAFKTKRVAQSAFHQNLKSWKITPPRYLRGWYRELSFEEYNSCPLSTADAADALPGVDLGVRRIRHNTTNHSTYSNP